MSAWYIFSSLGFYPVCPGSNEFALTAPLFERAVVRLSGGRTLTVTADDPQRNRYIGSVTLDGEPVETNVLTYEQLMRGGELHFALRPEPDFDRGTSPDARPYSLTRGEVVSIPYTTQSAHLFTEPVEITLATTTPGAEIRYTLDGSEPTERSAVYPSSGLEFFTGILRYRVFAKEGCGQTYTLYLSKSGHLFRDVPTNSWYFESIDRAVSLDLLKGVGDFAYEPDGGLNRAMFVTMLARAVGESLPDSAAGFSDVKGGQWYTAAMSWALRKNLIRGYEDGSYRPEALITREEMCVILDRLMQQRGETLHTGKLSFADTASISVWARDSVARMTALGLIRGAENNRFFPQRTTTRAEAATVMLRIYDHLH